MIMNAIDYGAGATLYILPTKIGGNIAGQSSECADVSVAEAIRHLIALPEAQREFSYIELHGSSKRINRDEAVEIAKRQNFPSE
jgi:hypothetical protein